MAINYESSAVLHLLQVSLSLATGRDGERLFKLLGQDFNRILREKYP